MAQLVERLTLAQVTVCKFESHMRQFTAVSAEPISDPLSPSLSASPLLVCTLSLSKINIKKIIIRGTWVAQSVKCPTSAQVMISHSVSSSPMSGSLI